MKKAFIILLILVAATILLSGCSSQKHNPARWEPEIKPLRADFFAIPDSGSAPLPVQFMATVRDGFPPYQFIWRFGDGDSSILQNPKHTFVQPGSYTVFCQASDDSGSISTFLKIIVTEPQVEPPDTTWHFYECYTINSSQKEVNEVLDNPQGKYKMNITVTAEKIKPEQTVSVQIGDKVYTVKLENLVTTLSDTIELTERVVVIIFTTPPHAYGHDIVICITITRLDST